MRLVGTTDSLIFAGWDSQLTAQVVSNVVAIHSDRYIDVNCGRSSRLSAQGLRSEASPKFWGSRASSWAAT